MTLPNDIEPVQEYWPKADREQVLNHLRPYLRYLADQFHLEVQVTKTPQGYIRVELRPEPEPESFGTR